MDKRYHRDPKILKVMQDSLPGFLVLRGELEKQISEVRVKIEDPAVTDAEIRSNLGYIKGLRKALELIPKE